MARIGYHASHEQYSPEQLLRNVQLAEQAGFQAAMCSDHFHPWTEQQGESGFAWAWLGAALQATSLSFGTVCAPGDRYHPAVIAQAAATLGCMFPDRFWFAVGSGEALNEHITGAPWPEKKERNARLRECVDIMRALWAGETVTHRGRVTVHEATLYSRPTTPPRIFGAALSEETARWAGSWADGLITVAKKPDELRRLVDAFRDGGGDAKPLYLQVALAYASTEEEAADIAHREWRQAGLTPKELADLRTPREFDDACRRVTRPEICKALRVSSDLSQHRDWLAADLELGFDTLMLHHVGRDQRVFIDAFARDVLPALT